MHADNEGVAKQGVADKLRALYETHNPAKVSDIPRLLLKYQGHEEDLLHAVSQKYQGHGAESSPPSPSRATPPDGSAERESAALQSDSEEQKREIMAAQKEAADNEGVAKQGVARQDVADKLRVLYDCLLYTSPSPRD